MNSHLIDTHAHLGFDVYEGDRREVVYRAVESGVRAILNVGIDLDSSRRSVSFSEEYSPVYAAVGIHPHDVAAAGDEDLAELETLLQHPKVVAIGEVGLDFYRNHSPEDVQRRYLRLFLDWSLSSGLPLIIHTREADDTMLSMLRDRSRSGWRGVFHCYSGDEAMAEQVLRLGFYISFTGVITFKNSRAAEVLRQIPLDRLLVETDCPYMAPAPHRGKRNEPAYVNQIAQKMAEIKGVPFQEVARVTSANAEELFHLNIT